MKEKITVVVPLGQGRNLEVLESLENQEEKVKIIIERGSNPSANRNQGAKKTKTEIIAFVNAHSILPKDWAKMSEIFLIFILILILLLK